MDNSDKIDEENYDNAKKLIIKTVTVSEELEKITEFATLIFM